MMAPTHKGFGILLALVLINDFSLIGLVIASFGSLMPDIDHPQSVLGRYVKPLGRYLSHRGFTHSLIGFMSFSVLLLAPVYYFEINIKYSYFFMVGYASHLIADMMNVSGIPLFWPDLQRIRILRISTGKLGETVFLGCIYLGIIYKLYSLFFNI